MSAEIRHAVNHLLAGASPVMDRLRAAWWCLLGRSVVVGVHLHPVVGEGWWAVRFPSSRFLLRDKRWRRWGRNA